MSSTATFLARPGLIRTKASPEDVIEAYQKIWEALGGVDESTPTSFVVSMDIAKSDDVTDRLRIGSARVAVVARKMAQGSSIIVSADVTLDRKPTEETLERAMGLAERIALDAARMGDIYFKIREAREALQADDGPDLS